MARMDGYPSYFPEDAPPNDAEHANGELYRLVKTNPPTVDCFQCTCIENKKKLDKYRGEQKILACGTSFSSKLEKIKHTQRLLANGMKKRLIAHGSLFADVGVMKQTGDFTHYTVWIMEGREPYEYFKCVE